MSRVAGADAATLHQARAAMRARLRKRQALPDAIRRQEATQATLNKFRGQPFDWRTGHHCVRLAHFHLRQMGLTPPTLPRVRSALAARRALAERDWDSVAAMLDSLLERIPPAAMLPGDLAVVPGGEGFDAVFVCCGPCRLFGWREDQPGAVVLEVGMSDVAGAWRVR